MMGWEDAFKGIAARRTPELQQADFAALKTLPRADPHQQEAAIHKHALGGEQRSLLLLLVRQRCQDTVDREMDVQRALRAQARAIQDQGFGDRVAAGWPALTAVLAGALAIGNLAGFSTWKPKARTVYAVGAAGVSLIAAGAEGRRRSDQETRRIEDAMRESSAAVRRARTEATGAAMGFGVG